MGDYFKESFKTLWTNEPERDQKILNKLGDMI